MNRAELRQWLLTQWERRLRGIDLWPHPVHLEPSFATYPANNLYTSFLAFSVRRFKFLRSLLERRIERAISTNTALPTYASLIGVSRYATAVYRPTEKIVEFQVRGARQYPRHVYVDFVSSLTDLRFPISFEVIGFGNSVVRQLSCRTSDADYVEKNLLEYFPELRFKRQTDYLSLILERVQGSQAAIDFTLKDSAVIPVHAPEHFEIDPLYYIEACLAACGDNTVGVFQVQFLPTAHDWGTEIRKAARSVGRPTGASKDADLVPYATEKTKSRLFCASMRACVRSSSEQHALDVLNWICNAVTQCKEGDKNTVVNHQFQSERQYSQADHVQDVLGRLTRRTGLLLNGHELVGFFHFRESPHQQKSGSKPETVLPPVGVVNPSVLHKGVTSEKHTSLLSTKSESIDDAKLLESISHLATDRGIATEPLINEAGFAFVVGNSKVACIVAGDNFDASVAKRLLEDEADEVATLCTDHTQRTEAIAQCTEALGTLVSTQVRFLILTEVDLFLNDLYARSKETTQTIGGYAVRVSYVVPPREEQQARNDAVARQIVGSLKRRDQ